VGAGRFSVAPAAGSIATVGAVGEPVLGGVASELDLRARVTHVLFRHGDFTLLSPLGGEADIVFGQCHSRS